MLCQNLKIGLSQFGKTCSSCKIFTLEWDDKDWSHSSLGNHYVWCHDLERFPQFEALPKCVKLDLANFEKKGSSCKIFTLEWDDKDWSHSSFGCHFGWCHDLERFPQFEALPKCIKLDLANFEKMVPLARFLLQNGMIKTGLTVALGVTLRGAMIQKVATVFLTTCDDSHDSRDDFLRNYIKCQNDHHYMPGGKWQNQNHAWYR